jgi:hypothetical protein
MRRLDRGVARHKNKAGFSTNESRYTEASCPFDLGNQEQEISGVRAHAIVMEEIAAEDYMSNY